MLYLITTKGNDMTHQIATALEQEFGLPFEVIQEIGLARQADDIANNAFDSGKYMSSPVCKSAVYEKHGLSFERGEEIGWAYIHDMGKA